MYNMEDNNSLENYLNGLNVEDSKKKQIKKRILAFQDINKQIEELKTLLRTAQKETISYYKQYPQNAYTIVYPTDLIQDYIKDIKDILKSEE